MSQREEQSIENVKKEGWEEELSQIMSGDAEPRKKKKKWSKGKKKIIIFLIIGIIIVLLLLLKSCGQSTGGGVRVMTKTLTKQKVVDALSIQGPISGTNSVHVASNLNAEIIEILVKEGDKVEKDQLLGVIDDEDVQKEVSIAQNAYDLAIAEYNDQVTRVETDYAKARQDLATASTNLQRIRALHQSGGASQVELEEAQTAYNNANRELLTYTVENGKAVPSQTYALRVENSRLELEKKKEAIDNTRLKSPIEGTVIRVNSKVGQYADKVEDDRPIFIIENLDALELKINISEYSIGKVSLGQKVTIRADILNGESVAGEVVSISPTGEEKGSGSTERVIPTTVKIIDEHTRLIAGITAKAEILLAEEEDTLAIPIAALIQNEDGDFVAVVENNKAHLIPIKTGVESDIMIAVHAISEEELTEGMTIIINPFEGMVEGTPVLAEGGQ